MTEEIEKTAQIIKLSASAIKTYEQCPKKYYFNYIEQVPKKQWDHFDLGNLCHKTLEIFHGIYMRDGLTKKKTLSNLMSHSFSIARNDFKNMNDTLVSEAKDMLAEYLKVVQKQGMPLVKGVEQSFTFNLTETVLMRGFIDRIDVLKDGRFRIIDYKTTKNDKYLDDFQLLIYGLWLKKDHPDIKSFKGAYVLLRHGCKMKEYEFNIEDINKIEKKLISYSEKIKTENQWTPIPTALCNWCDFKDICPAQSAW
jgi:RecB family exonuclease